VSTKVPTTIKAESPLLLDVGLKTFFDNPLKFIEQTTRIQEVKY